MTHPDSLYRMQVPPGRLDPIPRPTGANLDDDAQDAGEAKIVYENAESGFSGIDLVSLAGGDLLVTDTSGNRVFRLTDLDNDGCYASAGERTLFFAKAQGRAADIRRIASLSTVPGGGIDPFLQCLQTGNCP